MTALKEAADTELEKYMEREHELKVICSHAVHIHVQHVAHSCRY